MQSFIGQDNLRLVVLESGTEDYTGLYEVIWELNSMFPNVSEHEKICAARDVLKHLLAEELIELYEARWPPVEHTRVGENIARIAMERDEAWRMYEGGPDEFLAYVTTQSGEEELSRLSQVIFGSRNSNAVPPASSKP